MTFSIRLELLQRYNLRNKPSKLTLVPFDRSSSIAHPSNILRKYLIPNNTRLQLTIRKDNQAGEKLSGSICIIRINHLEENCKSAYHRRPALCLGNSTNLREYLTYHSHGSFLYGSRLNEIQIAVPEGPIVASDCICSLSLHVTGTLNGGDIDLTIHAAITPGGPRVSINQEANYYKKNENFSMRLLYLWCSCVNCKSNPEFSMLSERQKYLYKLSRKFP